MADGHGAESTRGSNCLPPQKDEDLQDDETEEAEEPASVLASSPLLFEEHHSDDSTRSANPVSNPSPTSSVPDTKPCISFPNEGAIMVGKKGPYLVSCNHTMDKLISVLLSENTSLHKPVDHFIDRSTSQVEDADGDQVRQQNHEIGALKNLLELEQKENQVLQHRLAKTESLELEIGALKHEFQSTIHGLKVQLDKHEVQFQKVTEENEKMKTLMTNLQSQLQRTREECEQALKQKNEEIDGLQCKHEEQLKTLLAEKQLAIQQTKIELQKMTQECEQLKTLLANEQLKIECTQKNHEQTLKQMELNQSKEIASLSCKHAKEIERVKVQQAKEIERIKENQAETQRWRQVLGDAVCKLHGIAARVQILEQKFDQKVIDFERDLSAKDETTAKLQAQVEHETIIRECEELRQRLANILSCSKPDVP